MHGHAHRPAARSDPAPEVRRRNNQPQASLSLPYTLHRLRRLGLSPSIVGPDRMELRGCFSDRLELRVMARPPGPDDATAPLVFDIHGRWRAPRRLGLRPCDSEEWLGLDSLGAIAFLRGLRNDAIAETQGIAAVTDGFDHRGHRVINPFRDRFGNETSPDCEYGDAYRRWRDRALDPWAIP